MATDRNDFDLPPGAFSPRCSLLLDVTVETIRSDPDLRLCEGLRLIEAARMAISRMAPEALDSFDDHVEPGLRELLMSRFGVHEPGVN